MWAKGPLGIVFSRFGVVRAQLIKQTVGLDAAVGDDRSQPQAAADDLLHDLGCPTVDPCHSRVAPASADLVLRHVPVAAMKLQAAIKDAELELGRPELGSGRVGVGQQSLAVRLDAAV